MRTVEAARRISQVTAKRSENTSEATETMAGFLVGAANEASQTQTAALELLIARFEAPEAPDPPATRPSR